MSEKTLEWIYEHDNIILACGEVIEWVKTMVNNDELRKKYRFVLEDIIELRAQAVYEDMLIDEPDDCDDDYHGEDKGYA